MRLILDYEKINCLLEEGDTAQEIYEMYSIPVGLAAFKSAIGHYRKDGTERLMTVTKDYKFKQSAVWIVMEDSRTDSNKSVKYIGGCENEEA